MENQYYVFGNLRIFWENRNTMKSSVVLFKTVTSKNVNLLENLETLFLILDIFLISFYNQNSRILENASTHFVLQNTLKLLATLHYYKNTPPPNFSRRSVESSKSFVASKKKTVKNYGTVAFECHRGKSEALSQAAAMATAASRKWG